MYEVGTRNGKRFPTASSSRSLQTDLDEPTVRLDESSRLQVRGVDAVEMSKPDDQLPQNGRVGLVVRPEVVPWTDIEDSKLIEASGDVNKSIPR